MDLERDHQAFMELREKLQRHKQILGAIDDADRRSRKEMQVAALTGKEITALPDDTPVYKAAGKAYFLASKVKIEQELAGHVQALQDDLQNLNSQRARAERALLEAENEIRELLKHSPELASKLVTLAG